MTMLKLLSEYPLEEVLRLSKEPLCEVIASVTYEDRQLAKDRGYTWDGERKKWVKKLKQSYAKREAEQAPFHVNIYEKGA